MDKLELIKRNTAEILVEEELKELLKKKKEISVYWGTMPTGSISIAYFFPMLKIADFLNAGLKVKILIADLHAALDGISWDILEARSEYYQKAIITSLVVALTLQAKYFIQGYDLFFVFLFMFLHFGMFLIPAIYLFKKYPDILG
jgi:tyrosyl-tRNA synthetase